MTCSNGRIVILLAMLLLGADCVCASLPHAEGAEHRAAMAAPSQSVKAVKHDASLPGAPGPVKRSRLVSLGDVRAKADVLSRHCLLLI